MEGTYEDLIVDLEYWGEENVVGGWGKGITGFRDYRIGFNEGLTKMKGRE